ncbi:MAG TPA: hypothetical protein VKN18_17575 [Blastocatellia bacterium]|nr:hypothetical protein [Blastocatellia bacterium]
MDWLADRVLAAIAEADEIVDWASGQIYLSPLLDRIASIRSKIEKTAKKRGWPIPEGQLDDRHIVRRMILKRCIYGVDLNAMAVELAKVGLWLHTFTVGAPLSFLDRHLRCGDSLFGERVRGALDMLEARGALLMSDELKKAKAAVASMQKIEALTDADITEVAASAESFRDVEMRTRPIGHLMDFLHATRWCDPKDKSALKLIDEVRKAIVQSRLCQITCRYARPN